MAATLSIVSAAFRRRPASVAAVLLLLLPLLTSCGINTIPTLDEQVNADWAQVQNQYKRRADLVPNLVDVVKGYAEQEQNVLADVVEARAKVGQMQLPGDMLTQPEAFKQFQQNQAALSSALSAD